MITADLKTKQIIKHIFEEKNLRDHCMSNISSMNKTQKLLSTKKKNYQTKTFNRLRIVFSSLSIFNNTFALCRIYIDLDCNFESVILIILTPTYTIFFGYSVVLYRLSHLSNISILSLFSARVIAYATTTY